MISDIIKIILSWVPLITLGFIWGKSRERRKIDLETSEKLKKQHAEGINQLDKKFSDMSDSDVIDTVLSRGAENKKFDP